MIQLRDIRKSYQAGSHRREVLRGVDISIASGEFLAIRGCSGGGKTTLMNILGLLDRPSGGEYLLEGRSVLSLTDAETSILRGSRIGFVFQMFHLIDRLTALDNVMLPFLYAVGYPNDARVRAQRLLARVGLADHLHDKPHSLSGGQQQRVAIARGLVNDPAVILADEPTGNLDMAAGRDVMELLRSLHSDGRTIVVVTHDEVTAGYCERVVTLRDGVLLEGDLGE